jgi:hypothetical protein
MQIFILFYIEGGSFIQVSDGVLNEASERQD